MSLEKSEACVAKPRAGFAFGSVFDPEAQTRWEAQARRVGAREKGASERSEVKGIRQGLLKRRIPFPKSAKRIIGKGKRDHLREVREAERAF